MNPVLPARTSTSVRPNRWFVLWKEIGRLPLNTVYSDIRMIDEMRSSCDAWVISRAMSYAKTCFRTAGPKHVFGIRHGAADHPCVAGRAHFVDHADVRIHRVQRQAPDLLPQHEPPVGTYRRRRAGGQDRVHFEGRLLPGHCPAPSTEWSERRGRRLWRALQRGPLHGVPEPPQLGLFEGLDALRRQARTDSSIAVVASFAIQRNPAASLRHPAAAWRSCPRRP